MKIWLDDIRDAPDDSWIVLRTGGALAGMLMVHDGDVEIVSFDHDLADFDGDTELTGYTWLCQIEAMVKMGQIKHVPELVIHSANPVGRKNMQAAIDSIERMRNG